MFRQGQLAVHGLAILLGRNEAGISNRGKIFTSMRSSASLHVIWAKSEEEEEEGTFWGKKAFLGTIVK